MRDIGVDVRPPKGEWDGNMNCPFYGNLRVRGQIRNLEDTRAPLADEYTWGFVGDVHSDYGRSYAIEFYQRF